MMADGEHGRTQENDSLMSALGTTTGMVAALLGYRSRVLHLYGKTTISHGALSGIWYRISFCSLLPCQLKSTGQGFMLQQEWLAIPHNTNTNTCSFFAGKMHWMCGSKLSRLFLFFFIQGWGCLSPISWRWIGFQMQFFSYFSQRITVKYFIWTVALIGVGFCELFFHLPLFVSCIRWLV